MHDKSQRRVRVRVKLLRLIQWVRRMIICKNLPIILSHLCVELWKQVQLLVTSRIQCGIPTLSEMCLAKDSHLYPRNCSMGNVALPLSARHAVPAPIMNVKLSTDCAELVWKTGFLGYMFLNNIDPMFGEIEWLIQIKLLRRPWEHPLSSPCYTEWRWTNAFT